MTAVVVCESLLEGRAGAVCDALRAEGHDVALVDPYVSPEPRRYSFAALADAIAAARDGRIVAVGASVGSGGALAFARRHPARCAALILVHPLFLYGPRRELTDLARAVRARGSPEVWRRLFDADALPPATPDDVLAAALEGLGDEALLDGEADLAAVAAPTLLVARAGDPLHAMEVATAYWRIIPTTRMVNETPGEVPLWQRPADLAATIRRFLSEVLA